MNESEGGIVTGRNEGEAWMGKYPGFSSFRLFPDPLSAPKGWVLLEVFHTVNAHEVGGHMLNTPTGSGWVPHILPTSALNFLFGLAERSELAELSDAKLNLQKSVTELTRENSRLTERVSLLEEDRDLYKHASFDHAEDAKNQLKLRQKGEVHLAQLERQLQKLREHFGSKTIAEVLGSET